MEGIEREDSLHLQTYPTSFDGMAVSGGISGVEPLLFSCQIKDAAAKIYEAEYCICLLHKQI